MTFQTLRVHGGYAGASDEELLSIPYARLLQAVRLASHRAAEAQRTEWRLAAFVGWQVLSAVAGSMGGKGVGDFGAYLRKLNLDPKEEEPRAERTASDNAALVRDAFRRGVMRRAE